MIRRALPLTLFVAGMVLSNGCEPYQAQFMGQGRIHFDTSPAVSWTKDGQGILFTYEGRIYLVDSEGRSVSRWLPDYAPKGEDAFGERAIGIDLFPDANPVTGQIAYTTFRHAEGNADHSYEIASANFDGSGYRRLTDSKGVDLKPSWSPDGSQIAFVSNRIGDYNTYVIDASGSNLVSVASSVFVGQNKPVWSPDGRRLALWARDGDLYTVEPDGSNLVHLGKATATPAWSPDGQRIAFVGNALILGGSGFETIFVADPDGFDADRRPTSPDLVASFAAPLSPDVDNLVWTPNGASLQFTAYVEHDGWPNVGEPFWQTDDGTIYSKVLYRIETNGSGGRILSRVISTPVAWSPDAGKVAFLNHKAGLERNNNAIVSTMLADGSQQRVLVRRGNRGPETVLPE